MTRWRAPQPNSTALITREGFEKLKSEVDYLWHTLRPRVVKALENAEYTYRKKQLGEIDRRARYLSKRIPQLKVVDALPADQDAIYFGAHVEVENFNTGQTTICRIVGPDEIDASLGWISVDSPLARAALKKRVGDEFFCELPAGPARFVVHAVGYQK